MSRRAARRRRGTATGPRPAGRTRATERGRAGPSRHAAAGSDAARRAGVAAPDTAAPRLARPTAAQVTADESLPPWDRGPARAYLRDVVDAHRHLLGVLFVPAFGLAMITTFGPASELQRLLQTASLVALAVVLVEVVVRGLSYTRMARAALPGMEVDAVSSTFYVFMRAHRPRSLRRPAPRVGPS